MSDDRRRLDDPRTVQRIVLAVYLACGLLLIADLFYTKKPLFGFESWFGFYPVFGFAVSFTLVLAAKQMRKLVGRGEDYYEPREPARHETTQHETTRHDE